MEKEWFDYREIKNLVTMGRLLEHYNVPFQHMRQLYLRCPLPIHGTPSKKTSFNVNLERDIWACWDPTCKALATQRRISGNVLGFVMAMEDCDLKEAPRKIIEWFGAKHNSPRKEESYAHEGKAVPQIRPAAVEHNLVDWLERKTPPNVQAGERADNPSPPDISAEAQPVTTRYMQETDKWFDDLVKRGERETDDVYWKRIRNGVKARLLLSYKNGQKAVNPTV